MNRFLKLIKSIFYEFGMRHVHRNLYDSIKDILGGITTKNSKISIKFLKRDYTGIKPQMKMEPIRINKNINSKAQRYYQKRKSRLHKM